ncbi:MAG: hypothetical protein KC910_29505 [Candidatus Eremiobacteraeota bacterium]|nr:hypothetical protein [Candidatus Eremiobacteraeota bacterium]
MEAVGGPAEIPVGLGQAAQEKSTAALGLGKSIGLEVFQPAVGSQNRLADVIVDSPGQIRAEALQPKRPQLVDLMGPDRTVNQALGPQAIEEVVLFFLAGQFAA